MLWLAAIATLGEIYYAWVWNNVDKPKIIIVLIACAFTACIWVGAVRLLKMVAKPEPTISSDPSPISAQMRDSLNRPKLTEPQPFPMVESLLA